MSVALTSGQVPLSTRLRTRRRWAKLAGTGLGIVLNPDPASTTLAGRREELIAHYLAKDFSVLEGRKSQALGLVANDWRAIRALLDARPRPP